MNKELFNCAKYLTFLHSIRHVNLRGYIREVEVQQGKPDKDNLVRVKVLNTGEVTKVYVDDFYHTLKGKLIDRGIEFKRLHDNHPVEVVEVPSL